MVVQQICYLPIRLHWLDSVPNKQNQRLKIHHKTHIEFFHIQHYNRTDAGGIIVCFDLHNGNKSRQIHFQRMALSAPICFSNIRSCLHTHHYCGFRQLQHSIYIFPVLIKTEMLERHIWQMCGKEK
jgi:hypothetical protein